MMETSRSPARILRFEEFEVDVCLRQLRKGGERIRLQEQPFQVLLALLQRQGELVTRDELREQIWPKGTFVDFDHGLNTAIKKIRGALGDCANVPRYVETIPRRGYRFLVPVALSEEEHSADMSPENALPHQARNHPLWSYSPGRRVFLILGIALVSAALIYSYARWFSARESVHGPVTLMVLPFQNMSGDSTQDYFCEGFSEELTTQLGRIDPKRLAIVARLTAAAYARNKTIAEIGRDLHVDYVLGGSVRRDQRRVRVTAQLIRVRDQGYVWTNEFDREFDSVLSIQAEIAGAIAQQVQSVIKAG